MISFKTTILIFKTIGYFLRSLISDSDRELEVIVVESLKDPPASEQAELIADKFAEVANEYDKLKKEDIDVPDFCPEQIPQFTENEVEITLSEMDINKSNVKGDISVKLLKIFAIYFAKPVTNVLETTLKQGRWPDIYKLEIVAPVQKQFSPKNIDELRNISGLLNLDTIAERLIAELNI